MQGHTKNKRSIQAYEPGLILSTVCTSNPADTFTVQVPLWLPPPLTALPKGSTALPSLLSVPTCPYRAACSTSICYFSIVSFCQWHWSPLKLRTYFIHSACAASQWITIFCSKLYHTKGSRAHSRSGGQSWIHLNQGLKLQPMFYIKNLKKAFFFPLTRPGLLCIATLLINMVGKESRSKISKARDLSST